MNCERDIPRECFEHMLLPGGERGPRNLLFLYSNESIAKRSPFLEELACGACPSFRKKRRLGAFFKAATKKPSPPGSPFPATHPGNGSPIAAGGQPHGID